MSKMKLFRKRDYVIILLIAVALLYCIVKIVIEKHSKVVLEEPFEVQYISRDDFVDLIETRFHAKKIDSIDSIDSEDLLCNYYSSEKGLRYDISYDVVSYVKKSLTGRQYCSLLIFVSTEDARNFFISCTNMYTGTQIKNAYYCDENQGYCILNFSGDQNPVGSGGIYMGTYYVDNEVLSVTFLTSRPIGFDIGNCRSIDYICSEIGVVAPWNVEFDEDLYDKWVHGELWGNGN